MTIRVEPADPRDPPARELIAELDAYLSGLYEPQHNHLDPADELAKAHVVFLLARTADAQPIGCGAIKTMPGYAEIKRLFVRPQARGIGAARAIMAALEQHARALGVPHVRLETGVRQPESISLYRALGYVRIARFGDYPDDPWSVFMGKSLDSR